MNRRRCSKFERVGPQLPFTCQAGGIGCEAARLWVHRPDSPWTRREDMPCKWMLELIFFFFLNTVHSSNSSITKALSDSASWLRHMDTIYGVLYMDTLPFLYVRKDLLLSRFKAYLSFQILINKCKNVIILEGFGSHLVLCRWNISLQYVCH